MHYIDKANRVEKASPHKKHIYKDLDNEIYGKNKNGAFVMPSFPQFKNRVKFL